MFIGRRAIFLALVLALSVVLMDWAFGFFQNQSTSDCGNPLLEQITLPNAVQNHLREGGPGNLVIVASAGILNTSKNRENADNFLRFLLSEDAQRYFTEQALDYPLVDGIAANDILKPLSEVNTPDIDQSLLGDIEGTLDLMRELDVIP